VAGIKQILKSLEKIEYHRLWMVLGFVSDKDISSILSLLPKNASYVFCEAIIPRALNSVELLVQAQKYGLVGVEIPNVNEAIVYAKSKASSNDLIYIGGSTFVVAEISEEFNTFNFEYL